MHNWWISWILRTKVMLTVGFCSPDPGRGGANLWARPQPAAGGSRCRHNQPPPPGVQDLPGTDPRLCQDFLTKGELLQRPTPSFGQAVPQSCQYCVPTVYTKATQSCKMLTDTVTVFFSTSFSSFSSLILCRCWQDWSRLEGSHRPNILMFNWWQQTSSLNARRWVPSSGYWVKLVQW